MLLLALVGCVHGPPAPVAASLWRPGEERQLSERDESLFSPDVRLAWAGDIWRGTAWGDLVELEASATRIHGTFASLPVDLVVETSEQQTTVRGIFHAQQGELRVGPTAISGTVGRCSYDLKGTDGHEYSGFRSCRGPLEPVRISIKTLGAHPLTSGRLAPLLLLLSR